MLKQNFQVVTGYLNLLSSEYFVELVFGFIFAICFFYALYRRHNKSIVEMALSDTVESNITATTPEVVETAFLGTVESNITVTPPEKFTVYFDSGSFYSGLEKTMSQFSRTECSTEISLKFDIIAFLDELINGRKCVVRKCYTGYPEILSGYETTSTVEAKQSKLRFIDFMKANGYEVPEGGLEIFSNKRPRQKAVNTLLIVHILNDAKDNKFDTAIIITGRGDLGPLITELKKLGKRYIYVGLYERYVPELCIDAYKNYIYDAKRMQKFFKPAPAK